VFANTSGRFDKNGFSFLSAMCLLEIDKVQRHSLSAQLKQMKLKKAFFHQLYTSVYEKYCSHDHHIQMINCISSNRKNPVSVL